MFPVDLVAFTEEILNGKFHFLCSVIIDRVLHVTLLSLLTITIFVFLEHWKVTLRIYNYWQRYRAILPIFFNQIKGMTFWPTEILN